MISRNRLFKINKRSPINGPKFPAGREQRSVTFTPEENGSSNRISATESVQPFRRGRNHQVERIDGIDSLSSTISRYNPNRTSVPKTRCLMIRASIKSNLFHLYLPIHLLSLTFLIYSSFYYFINLFYLLISIEFN